MKVALVLFVLLACLFIFADAAPGNATIISKRSKKHKTKKVTTASKKKGVSNAGIPQGPFHSTATECGAFFGLKYACNVPVTADMMAAAISQHQWVKIGAFGVSAVCGRTACVSAHGRMIKVVIKDQYLNGGSGMLDLTPAAWKKLANANDIHQGHINMSWNWC